MVNSDTDKNLKKPIIKNKKYLFGFFFIILIFVSKFDNVVSLGLSICIVFSSNPALISKLNSLTNVCFSIMLSLNISIIISIGVFSISPVSGMLKSSISKSSNTFNLILSS